jgi:F-type H+-transporting ATPase subunit epsilon
MAEIATGILTYEKAGKVAFFVVSGGIVEIQNNEVIILADVGESGVRIDLSRAKGSLERASKRLGGGVDAQGDSLDIARALVAEKRALARIAAAEASGAGLSRK